MGTCTVEGCTAPLVAKGLCRKHYNDARRRRLVQEAQARGRTCQSCGVTFSGRDRRAIYCSLACKERERWARRGQTRLPRSATRPPRSCIQCGASIPAEKDARTKFCSGRCKTAWWRANHPDRKTISRAAYVPAALRRESRRCLGCGGPIDPERTGSSKYCSRRCGLNHFNEQTRLRKLAEKPPCETCGKQIGAWRRQYCSDECARIAVQASRFGLDAAAMRMLLAQHDVCAICGTSEWGVKGPCVDHDHTTGEIRGVLCGDHNKGLGFFHDSPDELRAAIAYLER
jgi:predicted nucleic acid-binding Zn ribbon protein